MTQAPLNLEALLALANEDAESSGIDMNVAVKGGGGGRLLPQGYAMAQFVEYVELGNQPQEFQGKAKDPALEFCLGFALSGQTPTGEKFNNDDGTPYIYRPYSIARSQNEKSQAFKLFKAMNWKGTAKNFAQLLGQVFLVKIVHVPKSKTDPKLVSRIDLASFLPPCDPVTGSPYPFTPAAETVYRLFLWNRPTKAGWDSLYVEGTWDDGKSKNRIQETILAAVDFSGSPLEQMLLQSGVQMLPQAPVQAPASPVVAPAAPVQAQVPVAPVVAPAAPVAVPQVAAPLVPAAVAPVAVPPTVAIPTAPVAVPPVAVPGSMVLPA